MFTDFFMLLRLPEPLVPDAYMYIIYRHSKNGSRSDNADSSEINFPSMDKYYV